MGITRSIPLQADQLPPQKLSDFKQLAIAPTEYNIPEIPQKRSSTDKFFLVLLAISLIVLFILLIYTLSYSDIRRYGGYDDCGNLCGEKNEYVAGINCSGKDMTDFKYLLYNSIVDELINSSSGEIKKCVKSCNDEEDNIRYNIEGSRCKPEFGSDEMSESDQEMISEATDTSERIQSSLDLIFALMVFCAGLCFVMVILFRYATAFLIWGTIIGCYVILIIYTIYLWFAESKVTSYDAVCMTVITIIVTIFLISMFKRIPLVITIFKEAMKAIFAMPLIIFEPLLTFLAIFVAFLLFAVTLVYIITAGVLVKINDASYDYQYTPAMAFTIFFDILIFLWILKFIMGCQIMVISGAISTYYFSRDKSFLGSPIKTSFTNLIKHHLGSVALGSLILTISDILKALLKVLRSNRRIDFFLNCCGFLQTLLAYISTNAYIQIAMHGENFFRSGRRATQLICQNLCDIIAINSLGDFVLTMTKLFIVVCTMLFALLLYDDSRINSWAIIILSGIIISLLLSNCVFRVFETAIDTIFLCYCEDCQINDGEERPYYMSIELMQYIQESKSVMGPKSMAEA